MTKETPMDRGRLTEEELETMRWYARRGDYQPEHDPDVAIDLLLAEVAALKAERDRWARAAGSAMGGEVLAEERAATAAAGVAVSETIRRHDVAELQALREVAEAAKRAHANLVFATQDEYGEAYTDADSSLVFSEKLLWSALTKLEEVSGG